MVKLEGGFNNSVELVDGVVVKYFLDGSRTGMTPSDRRHRERRGLKFFGGTFAPAFLGMDTEVVKSQFIEGVNGKKALESGLYDIDSLLSEMGGILKHIHFKAGDPDKMERDYYSQLEEDIPRGRELLGVMGVDAEGAIDRALGVDMGKVRQRGPTFIHSEYFPGNMIVTSDGIRVIDWETCGYGSPYEDYAHMELFCFSKYGFDDRVFYEGYGQRPDRDVVDAYVTRRCLRYLVGNGHRFLRGFQRGDWFETHLVNKIKGKQ